MNKPLHHHVYVIELDPAVLTNKRFTKENPDADPAQACLYVGSTGLTPEERFGNHKRGYKCCSLARDFGLKLRTDLYDHYQAMTYKEAKAREVELAALLRQQGHAVWQN